MNKIIERYPLVSRKISSGLEIRLRVCYGIFYGETIKGPMARLAAFVLIIFKE